MSVQAGNQSAAACCAMPFAGYRSPAIAGLGVAFDDAIGPDVGMLGAPHFVTFAHDETTANAHLVRRTGYLAIMIGAIT